MRPEHRALVAKVERDTGLDIRSVDEVEIASLLNGTCHWCGKPIRYISIAWCDDCMDMQPYQRELLRRAFTETPTGLEARTLTIRTPRRPR